MKKGSLIIDEEYLNRGIERLRRNNTLSPNFELTERVIEELLEEISLRTKTQLIEQHFIEAENTKYDEKNENLYISLEHQRVKVERHKREGDANVVIATKMFRCMLGTREKIEKIILVAGDGNLKSAVEFIDDRFEVSTWIVGFRDNISVYLKAVIRRDNYIYLDDILPLIEKGREGGHS